MAARKPAASLSDYMEAVARRHQADVPPNYGYKAAVGDVNIGFYLETTTGVQVLEKPIIVPTGKPGYQGYMIFYAYCAKGGIEHLLSGNLPDQLPATSMDPSQFGSKEAIGKNFGNKDPKASAKAGSSDYCVALRVPAELATQVQGLSDDHDLWLIRMDHSVVMPFLMAVKTGNAEAVNKGIQGGIDAKTVDEDSIPALMIAANSGSLETCQVLLQAGADPNSAEPFNSKTPLMTAAQAGSTEIVELLLTSGADPDMVDSEGQTALMWAAVANKAETAKLLEAKGGAEKTNNEGLTAAAIAQKMGHKLW
jgi:hypothetical protein